MFEIGLLNEMTSNVTGVVLWNGHYFTLMTNTFLDVRDNYFAVSLSVIVKSYNYFVLPGTCTIQQKLVAGDQIWARNTLNTYTYNRFYNSLSGHLIHLDWTADWSHDFGWNRYFVTLKSGCHIHMSTRHNFPLSSEHKYPGLKVNEKHKTFDQTCKVYPSGCMRRIRWSCEGLTSVHNKYTGWSLKYLLLRHMYNLSLPIYMLLYRCVWTDYAERVLLTVSAWCLSPTN